MCDHLEFSGFYVSSGNLESRISNSKECIKLIPKLPIFKAIFCHSDYIVE